MWTAGPEKDGVDRIARGLDADETGRNRDIVRTDFAADDVEGLERHHFGTLDTRARGRSQAHLELRRIRLRKELCTETGQEKKQKQSSYHEVSQNQREPDFHCESQVPIVSAAQS